MEVTVVTGHTENADLLNAMYALRAKVFAKRLGWSVKTKSGMERDAFDTPETRYILILSGQQVIGCARFLDFSRATMVGSHFADLLDCPVTNHKHAAIESSRFCVDTEALRFECDGLAGQATNLLISSMIGWAALHSYQAIVTVTDIRIERLLRRLDVPFERLGRPRRIENTTAIAGKVDINAALARQSMPVSLTGVTAGSPSPAA